MGYQKNIKVCLLLYCYINAMSFVFWLIKRGQETSEPLVCINIIITWMVMYG